MALRLARCLQHGSSRIARARRDGVPTAMAMPATATPVLFDRALLRDAAGSRAQARAPSTFLLDRVADDMAERLAAVMREFRCRPISARRAHCALCRAREHRRCIARACRARRMRERCRSRRLARSRGLRAGAAIRQRPARAARADPPRAQAGRAVAGGDARRRHADRAAAILRRGRGRIEGGVSPHVAPFADLRDLGALLQRAGFALPVTDVDRVTVRYATRSR